MPELNDRIPLGGRATRPTVSRAAATALAALSTIAPGAAIGQNEVDGGEAFLPSYADKRDFNLFNPTPKELRRPLSADRPDTTESPYTVDAGAVQLEMSFFDYVKNGDTNAWTVAPLNLKIGLLNNTDIQFVLDPYVRIDEDDGDTLDGFGDFQIRLKINMWGNDQGRTALAVMPFVKFPTASDELSNDHVEGGIIVPFAIDLTEQLGLGLMFETDFVWDEDDDSYDADFIGTAVLGVDLTGGLGWYLEGVMSHSTDADADDFNIFSGITVRF